jgi:hypothetical protein
MKILSAVLELLYAQKQTDGHSDFKNAPEGLGRP